MNKNTYPFEYHIFDRTDKTKEFNDDDGENSEFKSLLYEKSVKTKLDASINLNFKSDGNKPMLTNHVL